MEKLADWTLYQTFYLATKYGNLEASRQLNVNVTTVRRRLSDLEKDLKISLLIRNGSKTLLSDEGQRLYEVVSKMNDFGMDIMAGSVDRVRNIEGVVRVSTMDGFGVSYLAPRIIEFLEMYPGIQVQLVTSPHIVNLSEREADVSINMMRPTSGRLIVKKISEFTVRLYGASSYLEKHGAPQYPNELKQHRFVTYLGELVSIPYVRWLPDILLNPNAPLVCTSLSAQHKACISGAGLAMLPNFMVDKNDELIEVLRENTLLRRDWWLVVHQDLQKVPRIRVFVDFIYSIMQRDRKILMGDL